MSEHQERGGTNAPKTCFQGDTIKMLMTFSHDVNITAARVTYAHQDDELSTITLSGTPYPTEASPLVGAGKVSEVELFGVVDESLPSGEYHATRLVFFQLMGGAYHSSPNYDTEWPRLHVAPPEDANTSVLGVELVEFDTGEN